MSDQYTVYLVDADDVGQEGQGLDLGCNEVSVQLLVVQLVLPAARHTTQHTTPHTHTHTVNAHTLSVLWGLR